MTSADWAKEHGKRPFARVVATGVAGVHPSFMGIGPVPAIRSALSRAGLEQGSVDLFDINEAFAQADVVSRYSEQQRKDKEKSKDDRTLDKCVLEK